MPVLSQFLRPVESVIGAAEERGGVGSIRRAGADADTGGDRDHLPVQDERLAQGVKDPLGDNIRLAPARVFHTLHDDGELVAA